MTVAIKKLLIANRGEIAIRIARTANALGISTVAIYSTDDAQSLHISYADECVELPGSGVNAYLAIDTVISAAQQSACDAIHPGYGLLSESATLAQACADNNIIFVGPSVSTLQSFGDKRSARLLAKSAGVPVIEGLDKVSSVADIQQFFYEQNQHAIMVKAVNGGGGRGMRAVTSADDIESAFTRCQAESLAAFGSSDLYVERFLPAVRHIEIQIVGDGSEVIHLWERDCTVQRRNQKLLELAPAPQLGREVKQALFDAANTLGKVCNYKGLGTVEFLVSVDAQGCAGEYFFIETNPRIQVEHTVTEAITGLDLVELQLRIASGETLADIGLTQDSIPKPQGYAIQARINTETLSEQGELVPNGGTIQHFQLPSGPGVRVDTYGYAGYHTNPNFDSLLAKFIIHSRSDDVSLLLRAADRALSETHISGVNTNVGFLRCLIRLPAIQQWQVSVRGIESQLGELLTNGAVDSSTAKQRFVHDVSDSGVTGSTQSIEKTSVDPADYSEGSQTIRVPLSSALVAFEVAVGDSVTTGQELAVVEAMKMQHVIKAPCAGEVTQLLASPGDTLVAEQPMLALQAQEQGQYDIASIPLTNEKIDLTEIRDDLRALQKRINLTLDDSRSAVVQKRHDRGQRTARENIDDLCDSGTFLEYGQLAYAAQRRKRSKQVLMEETPADGIVTGIGVVNGHIFSEVRSRVAIFSYDAMVLAGTQGSFGHKKTDRVLDVAAQRALPVIFFTEGGGGRPGDIDFADVAATGLDLKTFHTMARPAGGPKIGVNSGFCFAGNAALFGCCDIKIATRHSWIGMGGPAMIEAGGLGRFNAKEVGPANLQAANGLLDITTEDDVQAVESTKKVLSIFQGKLTDWETQDQRLLRHAIPEDRKRIYDIRAVIDTLADTHSFIELKREYGAAMITGFIRIEGRPMGLIANNPAHLGGAINASAATKAAGMMNLCNRFKLPVLSLCDTPGFMVGPDSEAEGAVGQACALMAAGAGLDVPMFMVCLRRGYGLGAAAMAGGSFSTTVATVAWPTGEFGPMGLEAGVRLGHKRALNDQPDEESRETLFNTLLQQAYERGSACSMASLLEIDAVIDPQDTRHWVLKSLMLR